MLNLLLALLCLPFAGLALDSPRFVDRQQARREIHAAYPWSVPFAWHVARSTPSPEARHTAEGVLDRWAADPFAWDCRVWLLIVDPEFCTDRVNLPWLTMKKYEKYKDSESARKAFVRIIHRIRAAGIPMKVTYWQVTTETNGRQSATEYPTDGVWPCETATAAILARDYGMEGVMTGINDMRFVLRGLPIITTSSTVKRAEAERQRHSDLFIPPPVVDMIWEVPTPRVPACPTPTSSTPTPPPC